MTDLNSLLGLKSRDAGDTSNINEQRTTALDQFNQANFLQQLLGLNESSQGGLSAQPLGKNTFVLNEKEPLGLSSVLGGTLGGLAGNSIKQVLRDKKLDEDAKEFASHFNNDPSAAQMFKATGGDRQKALISLQQKASFMKNALNDPNLIDHPEVQQEFQKQVKEDYLKANGKKESDLTEEDIKNINDNAQDQNLLKDHLNRNKKIYSELSNNPLNYRDIVSANKPPIDAGLSSAQRQTIKTNTENHRLLKQIGIIERNIDQFTEGIPLLRSPIARAFAEKQISLPILGKTSLEPLFQKPSERFFDSIATYSKAAIAHLKDIRGLTRSIGDIGKSLPEVGDNHGAIMLKLQKLNQEKDVAKNYIAIQDRIQSDYLKQNGVTIRSDTLNRLVDEEIDRRGLKDEYRKQSLELTAKAAFFDKIAKDAAPLGGDSTALIRAFSKSIRPSGKEESRFTARELNTLYDENRTLNSRVNDEKAEVEDYKESGLPGYAWYKDKGKKLYGLFSTEQQRGKDAI